MMNRLYIRNSWKSPLIGVNRRWMIEIDLREIQYRDGRYMESVEIGFCLSSVEYSGSPTTVVSKRNPGC
jgi:hypothetical protein